MFMTETLKNFAFDFVFMIKRKKPDGAGGFITTWEEGAPFTAIVKHDTTIEAQIAEKDETASTYTLFVDRKNILEAGDVIKRIEDGKVLMITSDSLDSRTPNSAQIDLASVTAKKWKLTS